MSDLLTRKTWRAGLAELVGTFFLALAALATPAPLTALAVGLTLAAFVYAIVDISGCNVNPAVTLGLVVTRRLPAVVGVLYVVAQLAGAGLARLLTPAVLGAPLPRYAAAGAGGEVVGVGFLVLTVLAVSTKAVPKSGSGVAIGAALLAGLLTTRGVLNPAIALAMGLGLSAALWAPLVGALVLAPLALLYLPTDDTPPAPADKKARARTTTTKTPPATPRVTGAARAWRAGERPGAPARGLARHPPRAGRDRPHSPRGASRGIRAPRRGHAATAPPCLWLPAGAVWPTPARPRVVGDTPHTGARARGENRPHPARSSSSPPASVASAAASAASDPSPAACSDADASSTIRTSLSCHHSRAPSSSVTSTCPQRPRPDRTPWRPSRYVTAVSAPDARSARWRATTAGAARPTSAFGSHTSPWRAKRTPPRMTRSRASAMRPSSVSCVPRRSAVVRPAPASAHRAIRSCALSPERRAASIRSWPVAKFLTKAYTVPDN